jgi:HlyD family secretion protein
MTTIKLADRKNTPSGEAGAISKAPESEAPAAPPAKPSTRPGKRTIVAAALMVLIGAGFGGYRWWTSHNAGAAALLVLQGNVEVRQVNLGFKVAGRIHRLAVDEGDTVTEGQSLGELDKVYFEESLVQLRAQRDQMKANLAKLEAGNRPEEIEQAQALVAEREATLTNAKVAFARAEQLLKSATGTRKTYDDAQAAQREAEARLNSARQAFRVMQIGPRREDIDAARAQLAEKEAAIQVSQRQLADAELTAPGPGVVLSRVRENGAIVNAGETVFVLSLTSPVWIRTYVSELDLPRIRPGMEVEVKTDTPGLAPLKGRIGFVSTTAEFTPKTVETRELRTALVYRLRIVVDDASGQLRQGMPMTVSVPRPPEGTKVGEHAQ